MEKREVMKTWELSLYELQRRPQEAVTDDTEIKINPRTLHSELMCPICLDVMTNTMTTKECLHRFCSECIITALRNGNKECPTCRKKLVSKRSLRHDPNFDALISKICPDKEQDVDQNGGNSFMNSPVDSPIPPQPQSTNGPNDDIEDNPDESQNDSSQKRKRSRQSGATNEDGSEPNADSAPNSHRKSSKKDNSDQTSKSRSSTSTAAANSSKTSSVDIILRLKPQPVSASEPKEKGSESTNDSNSADLVENLQPEVLCKFLKTSRDATVQHVAEYLKIRKDEVKEFIPAKWKLESLQEDSKFLLFVRKRQMPQNTQYEYMQLTEDSTLATVMSDYGLAKNKPIELYFSCQQMS